jgi:hypothetical protein
MYQSDLFDMQKFAHSNKGYRYILVVVDAFSKKVTARPIKRKSKEFVAAAMEDIFTEISNSGLLAPNALMASDLGTEFWNENVRKVFEKFNISHYGLRPPKKASIAEISGRYLIGRIRKYFYHSNTTRWIDNLQDFVLAKNSRPNKKLGGLSSSEINYDNQEKVFQEAYTQPDKQVTPLDIGRRVQISLDRLPFHKSYYGYFSDKVYIIKNRIEYNGLYRYTLIDESDNASIAGSYYAEELQPFLE